MTQQKKAITYERILQRLRDMADDTEDIESLALIENIIEAFDRAAKACAESTGL